MTDPYEIIMEAGDVKHELCCPECREHPKFCHCYDPCEGCGEYLPLAPFGDSDVMLCVLAGRRGCWDSAYHHREKKRGDCGVKRCRICYEEEE